MLIMDLYIYTDYKGTFVLPQLALGVYWQIMGLPPC